MSSVPAVPTRSRARRAAATVAAAALLLSLGPLAEAASYGSSTNPLKVSNGSGGSYGTYYGRVSLGNGTYGTTAQGYIKDYQPGDTTIYVKLTATISARSSTTRDSTSQRSNDSRWVSYPKFSSWHSDSVSKVDLRVCEDVRFWFDPCSSAVRAYTR